MDRRTPLIAAAALAFALFVVAAYLWTRPPEAPEQPMVVDHIRVANAGQLSVLNLIAQDQGYFAANGLDAEVQEYDSGLSAMDALTKGDADVAVASEFVGVRAMFAFDDLRILAQVAARDGDVFRLVARRSAGITLPAHLKGKKIGVSRRSAGEFYLWRFLLSRGLSLDDVTMIDLPASAMADELAAGDIDAAIAFEPTAYRIETKLGKNAIVWSAQGDLRAYGLAYATRTFAERRPEALERYLRALSQAEAFTRSNPVEARDIVMRILGFDAAYLDYVWDKLQPGLRLDQDLLLAMELQARWTIEQGLIDRTTVPNYLDRIRFESLQKVDPGAITILH